MEKIEIEKRFTYHAPKNNQGVIYTNIRDKVKEVALFLNENCPDSREKSIAFTKLEEVIFWSNASIARNT